MLLSACLGSGGSGVASTSGSVEGSAPNFEQMASDGRAMLQNLENTDETPVAAMPTTGTATYNGVAAFGDSADPEYLAENADILGRLQMEANFASETISGQIDNIRHINDPEQPAAGSVQISNGTIDNNAFTADMSGHLIVENEEIVVTGEMAGDFLGDDAEVLAGEMEAQLAENGFVETIYGAFVAQQ